MAIVDTVCSETDALRGQAAQQSPPSFVHKANVLQQQMDRLARRACLFAAGINELDIFTRQLAVDRDEHVRPFLYPAGSKHSGITACTVACSLPIVGAFLGITSACPIDMRYWLFFLGVFLGADNCVSEPVYPTVEHFQEEGRSLFVACEYKRAARAFESALALDPGNAALTFWLGKSYARLAEISSLLSAPRNARTARHYLEQAVASDPHNREYLEELFLFYLDSPEWFQGGLTRAAELAVRMDPGNYERMAALANSRREYRGPGWWIQRAVQLPPAAVGYALHAK